MSLFLKTNSSQISNVLIEDLGYFVPGSGTTIEIDELDDIEQAKVSKSLKELLTDNAFGPKSSTLILVRNGIEVDQDFALDYLSRLNIPLQSTWFGSWF